MTKIEIIQFEGDASPRRKKASESVDGAILWKFVDYVPASIPAYNQETQRIRSYEEITDAIYQRWEIIDKDTSQLEQERVAGIKGKAAQLIEEIAPAYKQRNMIARSVELDRIVNGGGQLSTSEQAEFDAMNTVWSYVKQVRAFSNELENREDKPKASDEVWPSYV